MQTAQAEDNFFSIICTRVGICETQNFIAKTGMECLRGIIHWNNMKQTLTETSHPISRCKMNVPMQ